MRLVFVLVLVAGCKSQPAQAPLVADVKLFCGAWEERGRPAKMTELATYLSSKIKSTELLEGFAGIGPDGTGIDSIEEVVRKAGVTSCPTLDWMREKVSP
jgi:hypothetical protein